MVGGGGGGPPVPPPPVVLQAASLEWGWFLHHLAEPTGFEAEATVDKPMRQRPMMANIAIILGGTRMVPPRSVNTFPVDGRGSRGRATSSILGNRPGHRYFL